MPSVLGQLAQPELSATWSTPSYLICRLSLQMVVRYASGALTNLAAQLQTEELSQEVSAFTCLFKQRAYEGMRIPSL